MSLREGVIVGSVTMHIMDGDECQSIFTEVQE